MVQHLPHQRLPSNVIEDLIGDEFESTARIIATVVGSDDLSVLRDGALNSAAASLMMQVRRLRADQKDSTAYVTASTIIDLMQECFEATQKAGRYGEALSLVMNAASAETLADKADLDDAQRARLEAVFEQVGEEYAPAASPASPD